MDPYEDQIAEALEGRLRHVRESGVTDLAFTRDRSVISLRRGALGIEGQIFCYVSRRADGSDPTTMVEVRAHAPEFDDDGAIAASPGLNRICTTAALVRAENGSRCAFARFVVPAFEDRWSFLGKWIVDAAVIGPQTIQRFLRGARDPSVWAAAVPQFESGWTTATLSDAARALTGKYPFRFERGDLVIYFSAPVQARDEPIDASLRLAPAVHPFWGPGCFTQLRFDPLAPRAKLSSAADALNALLFERRFPLSIFGSWYSTDPGALVLGQFLTGNESPTGPMLQYLAANGHDLAGGCYAEFFARAGVARM